MKVLQEFPRLRERQRSSASLGSLTFALSLGLTALAVIANTAQAQSAGQHARDMNDIAATPPQGGDEGAAAKPYEMPSATLPPRPKRPGFVAVAYHADTGSIWASAAHKTIDAAKKRALAGCNAATGGGCYIAAAVGGGGDKTASQVFVSQDGMGQFWLKEATGNGLLVNPDPAMRDCLSKSFGCDTLNGFEPGSIYLDLDPNLDQSEDYFPKGKLNQNRWAMVAQPANPTAASHKKSWLISGKENSAATRKDILDRCRADAGVPCAITAYALNGEKIAERGVVNTNAVLVHFVDGSGKNRWTTALPGAPKKKRKKSPLGGFLPTYPDPVTVKERIDRICPPSSCRVIATYDAATPRMQVIEDVK